MVRFSCLGPGEDQGMKPIPECYKEKAHRFTDCYIMIEPRCGFTDNPK